MSAVPFFMEDVPGKPAPARYPDKPGFKARGTSQEAAEGVAEKAATLVERTLACLQRKAMTPEEVAKELKEPVHNIRPRFSQLAKKNLIANTGERRKAMGGRWAAVWKAVTP